MEAFLESVQRRAFRMARFATGSDDDALDIVQEAMLALVRRYRFKPERQRKVLFYKILRNKIKDWHRRQAVRNRWRIWLKPGISEAADDTVDPIADFPDESSKNPAEQLILDDTVTAVDAAVRDLPERQQQAFLLRAWEELSVGETAVVMNCSEGSVKTHYARAVQKLRNVLGDVWA